MVIQGYVFRKFISDCFFMGKSEEIQYLLPHNFAQILVLCENAQKFVSAKISTNRVDSGKFYLLSFWILSLFALWFHNFLDKYQWVHLSIYLFLPISDLRYLFFPIIQKCDLIISSPQPGTDKNWQLRPISDRRILPYLVGFGRIWLDWSDLVGFGWIGRNWSDSVGFGRIWLDWSELVGFGRNLSVSVGFGRKPIFMIW